MSKAKILTTKVKTVFDLSYEVNTQAAIVNHFTKRVMKEAGCERPTMVGSRRVMDGGFFSFIDHAFVDDTYETAKQKVATSDFDIATKLDTFALEGLLRIVPQLKLKDVADKCYDIGENTLLREVYECKVGELLGTPRFQESISYAKRYYTERAVEDAVLELREVDIDILLVSDLDRLRLVWNTVPDKTFAKYLWKKSPTYLGAEFVQDYFRTLETLAKRAAIKPTKGVTIKDYEGADGLVPGPAPQIQWEVAPEPAQPVEDNWWENNNLLNAVQEVQAMQGQIVNDIQALQNIAPVENLVGGQWQVVQNVQAINNLAGAEF